jgi:hypothetical protein
VQKLTQEGRVKITKVPGPENPADLGTKHLDGSSIQRCLEKCRCYIRAGQSDMALRAEVQALDRSRPRQDHSRPRQDYITYPANQDSEEEDEYFEYDLECSTWLAVGRQGPTR